MIKEAIIKLSKKEDLTYNEAEEVMNEIMEGKATDVQMSSYLTALSLKGETIDEITASAAG
ncbi:MAG TPA: anthranilate phosphoribosyltransferase, partial [Candidatus Onthocola gallistercoris]|nr:anthranilate phosphoribosyltransferase [Candidatus Onthocola gallistercoris]